MTFVCGMDTYADVVTSNIPEKNMISGTWADSPNDKFEIHNNILVHGKNTKHLRGNDLVYPGGIVYPDRFRIHITLIELTKLWREASVEEQGVMRKSSTEICNLILDIDMAQILKWSFNELSNLKCHNDWDSHKKRIKLSIDECEFQITQWGDMLDYDNYTVTYLKKYYHIWKKRLVQKMRELKNHETLESVINLREKYLLNTLESIDKFIYTTQYSVNKKCRHAVIQSFNTLNLANKPASWVPTRTLINNRVQKNEYIHEYIHQDIEPPNTRRSGSRWILRKTQRTFGHHRPHQCKSSQNKPDIRSRRKMPWSRGTCPLMQANDICRGCASPMYCCGCRHNTYEYDNWEYDPNDSEWDDSDYSDNYDDPGYWYYQ
jgi:hypothetical protein